MAAVANVQARPPHLAASKRWAWVQYDGQPLWPPCRSLGVAESSLANRIKDWRLVVVASGDDVGEEEYARNAPCIAEIRFTVDRLPSTSELPQDDFHRFRGDIEFLIPGWRFQAETVAREHRADMEHMDARSALANGGWVDVGTRTAPRFCGGTDQSGWDPMHVHRIFQTDVRVMQGHWGIDLSELAGRVIDQATFHDALDVGKTTRIESFIRQFQWAGYDYSHPELPINRSHGKKGKGVGKGYNSFTWLHGAFFVISHRETREIRASPDHVQYVKIFEAREDRFAADTGSSTDDRT